MADTPEKKVKKWIEKRIFEIWPNSTRYMPVPSGFGEKGVADMIWCIEGLYVSIEAKAAGGKETKLQKIHGEKITKADGIRMLIEGNDEEAIIWLKDTIEVSHDSMFQGSRYQTP